MSGFEEPVDLRYLGCHWGQAYLISYWHGRYQAARKDDGTILAADTAEELLGLIRADYARNPVPRPRPPACGG